MIEPYFSNLKREAANHTRRRGGRVLSFADGLHPNPRAYKHLWWVFHAGSPAEGWVFLKDEKYAISTAEVQEVLAKIEAKNEVCFLYGHGKRRRGQGSPFDPDSPAMVDCAPGYDEDTDPEVEIDGVMHK